MTRSPALSRRVALTAGAATAISAVTTPGHAAKPSQLRVLSMNIWFGGTAVEPGPSLVADVIRATGADVVMLSESGDTTRWLADHLSQNGSRWHYAESSDTGILSRHPIVERGTLPFTTKAVIDLAGRQVAVYALHLEYRWYATYLPRGYAAGVPEGPYSGWDQLPGGPVTDVETVLQVNEESGRPAVVAQVIADAERERATRRSVLIGGDFNEPSILDWTAATAEEQDHRGLVVPWQSTGLLRDAGYVDAYRAKYPNPSTHPGTTWPTSNRAKPLDHLTWTPKADERDRIDYVFASPSPGVKLLDVGLVGTAETIIRNKRVPMRTNDFLQIFSHWPTDHQAVLATYRIAGPPARR